MGRFYDKAFSERQEADYNAMSSFDADIVTSRFQEAERFVQAMKSLLVTR
jgi:uncharacterized protein (UPF0332 family)